jgi:hypothetical protein
MKKSTSHSPEVLRLREVMAEIDINKPYSDVTASGLTECVIDYLNNVKGQQAERYHSAGVPFKDRKTGEQRFGRPIALSGTADIHATIKGRSVKIEIKIGGDRLSQKQRSYQQQVEKAGGVYFVARDFKSFAWWYKNTFEK